MEGSHPFASTMQEGRRDDRPRSGPLRRHPPNHVA